MIRSVGIICAVFLPFALVLVLLGAFTLVASPSSAAVTPIPPPCTEEKALEYKTICLDLGVPYDMPMMADFFSSQKYSASGFKANIEDVPVILSALQFCYVDEAVYSYMLVGYDDEGHPIYKWVHTGDNRYDGLAGVMGYIGRNRSDTTVTIDQIFDKIKKTADAKFVPQVVKYKAHLDSVTEAEYLKILKKYWSGLSQEDLSTIDVMHQEKYLPQMYGEYAGSTENLKVTLPPVTVGSATRADLIRVATSIINWPYEWGGKSTSKGKPHGGLDCSGYIDWVYYQCFGTGVGSGTAGQFYRCEEISESELMIGDLGFYYRPETVGDNREHPFNHVGIYVGEISGQPAFIHCGGSSFGTTASPTGRVGISINVRGKANSFNPLGGTFSPPMQSTSFQYFRRPQFSFAGE